MSAAIEKGTSTCQGTCYTSRYCYYAHNLPLTSCFTGSERFANRLTVAIGDLGKLMA